MPTKITTADGEVIESYSKEELDAQAKEAADNAIAKYQEENPDKSGELARLEADLKAKDEELAKLNDKDQNFAKLREQKDIAEANLEEFKKQIDDQLKEATETTKREVVEASNKDHYDETLRSLVGNDEAIKEKVEHHYQRLAGEIKSKGDITNTLREAWLLATKEGESVDALNPSVVSSGAAVASTSSK